MTNIEIRLLRLPHAGDLALPGYQTPAPPGSIWSPRYRPTRRCRSRTGRLGHRPDRHRHCATCGCIEGQVRASFSALPPGMAISVLNAPGTVDADYRGEVQVMLINFGA